MKLSIKMKKAFGEVFAIIKVAKTLPIIKKIL